LEIRLGKMDQLYAGWISFIYSSTSDGASDQSSKELPEKNET